MLINDNLQNKEDDYIIIYTRIRRCAIDGRSYKFATPNWITTTTTVTA